MSYLSKDEYSKRENSAMRRMAENSKIESLTEEQHDALSELCTIRHRLHSMPRIGETLFNPESAEHNSVWAALDTEQHDNKVLSMLTDAGLPRLDWVCDSVEYDDAMTWEVVHGEEPTEDDVEDAVIGLYDLAERFNTAVECYLREIDRKHGTNYAPTGKLRKSQGGN